MKIKHAFLAMCLSSQCYAGFAAGYIVGSGAAASAHRHSEGSDAFESRKFDYIIACTATFEQIDGKSYEYRCKNPPRAEDVLFMSTVFDSTYWPARIIYYMKRK